MKITSFHNTFPKLFLKINAFFVKAVSRIIAFLIFSLVYYSSSCQVIADSRAKIGNINFYLLNDEMNISYDLAYAIPKERFLINVKVFTDSDSLINARNFYGDIGDNISGGHWLNNLIPRFLIKREKIPSTSFSKKMIMWKMSKDVDSLFADIYVQIEAIHLNPKIIQPTGTFKAIALSTFYPGLGCSKTTLHPLHLLKGLAGYLCIAGSIRSDNLAEKFYSDYLAEFNGPDRNYLYNKTKKYSRNSGILIASAGAIWLSEYINILLADNNSKKTGFRTQLTNNIGFTGSDTHFTGLSLVYFF